MRKSLLPTPLSKIAAIGRLVFRSKAPKRVIAVGLTVTLVMTLFPLWSWTGPHSDVIDGNNQYAFLLSPPTPWAHLNTLYLWSILGLVWALTIIAYLLTQDRAKQQAAYSYWRQRWEQSTDPQQMLRASHAPDHPAQTLLRSTLETQALPSVQLLRASQQENNK